MALTRGNRPDIAAMNMWESLVNLSKSEEDEIRQYGLWIIGTAIQNNPNAQHSVSLAIIHVAHFYV